MASRERENYEFDVSAFERWSKAQSARKADLEAWEGFSPEEQDAYADFLLGETGQRGRDLSGENQPLGPSAWAARQKTTQGGPWWDHVKERSIARGPDVVDLEASLEASQIRGEGEE